MSIHTLRVLMAWWKHGIKAEGIYHIMGFREQLLYLQGDRPQ